MPGELYIKIHKWEWEITHIPAWQEAWPGDNASGQSKKQWLKKKKGNDFCSLVRKALETIGNPRMRVEYQLLKEKKSQRRGSKRGWPDWVLEQHNKHNEVTMRLWTSES